MTHAELVAVAGRWLRGRFGCGVVVTEHRCSSSEVPDALGFRYGGTWSVLVECKTSRRDFLRDARKSRTGMGQERWYLTPPGLLRVADIPHGWGLAEADVAPSRVRIILHPPATYLRRQGVVDPAVAAADAPVLYSLAWRLQNPSTKTGT